MTPHINAEVGSIAKTVLMPGDPIRAKVMASKYLDNCKLVNDVRGIYAYTGTYKGVEITIMASGMGMPSIGIYSYELYKYYDVENIIRIGSAGAYTDKLDLYDIILVTKAYTESSYAKTQNGELRNILDSSDSLNSVIKLTAKQLNQKISMGTIHSSDVYYKKEDNYRYLYEQYGCLACEMETFALLHNANVFKKRATCLLTISNNLVTGDETTSEERQNSFDKMVFLALNAAINL